MAKYANIIEREVPEAMAMYKYIKRGLDILFSLSFFIIFWPFFLLLWALLKWQHPRAPALFVQERVGEGGKIFYMYKFRTMVPDAEKETGPVLAEANDPRITPLGKFFRKYRLDEWPQFINVLKGEMSIVGPRPERPFFVEQFSRSVPQYFQRLKLKPGITGLAQVTGRYDSEVEEKIKYDLYYFENYSLLLDLKVLLKTVLIVLTGRGAR